MTDPDDALRRELGWTGPEESDCEPDTGPAEPAKPAEPPVPRRPPVDFVSPHPTGPNRVQPESNPQTANPGPGPRGGPGEAPPPSFRDPDAPRGSLRDQRPQYGPPPQAPARDTREFPPGAGRPDNAPWPQHPGWPVHAPRPPAPTGPAQPPFGGPTSQPWPGDGHGPEARVVPPPPPASYADRIRVDDLVPARRIPPARGWRRLVYRATFGMINPGQSPDEIRQAELEAKVRAVLRGHYKVGVMGKGGVGKTTVSACVGSVFAELRHEDRVVAVDADTAFGKLGSRVDPKAQGSYWELASDQHLESFADIRSRVGNNAAGLFVLAGEATPARRRVLDPAIYREATSRLDRYFSISIIDCSSTMDAPSHRRCCGTSTRSSWCPRHGRTARRWPARRWTGWPTAG